MILTIVFVLFCGISITLAIQAILQLVFRRSLAMETRIGTFIGEAPVKHKVKKQRSSYQFEHWKKHLNEKMTNETKSELRKKLSAAGLDHKWTPADYRLIQLVVASFLGTLGVVIGMEGSQAGAWILGGSLAGLGYYYPSFYLSVRKRKRTEKIERSLADFFDMVNLSIEAGLGIDAAFMKACQQSNGPLSKEFTKAMEEMRLGKSRREALTGLRTRVEVDEFRSVLTTIIQADQLGIGMSKAIHALTHRIREHQRQKAREKGMKAPIKMLFPLIFFIFPSLFIVLLGPFMIYLIKYGLH